MSGPRSAGRSALVYVALTVALSVVAARFAHERRVEDVGFMLGPAIASVRDGDGLVDATRMPVVPWFLGLIGRVSSDATFVIVVKNLVFGLAIGAVVWAARRERTPLQNAPPTWFDAGALAYVATFPQLLRHGLGLAAEEAYLIPLLACLFFFVLRAKPGESSTRVLGVAALAALVTLTKSTMLLPAMVLSVWFGVQTRSRRATLIVCGAVVVAALGWSLRNLVQTGHFLPGTSTDGYNFWKGNNEHTLDYFPFRSLDALSDRAPALELGENEWHWSARCIQSGVAFDLNHPIAALQTFGWRLYQVFVSFVPEQPPEPSAFGWFRWIGVPHMLVFRSLFWLSIGWSVRALMRRTKAGEGSSLPIEQRRTAGFYLAFLGAFTLPYLVAWGVERRILPLVIPAVLFVRWILREGRPHRLALSAPSP